MHRPIQSSKTMGEVKYWKIWADTQWVVGTKGGKVELPKRERILRYIQATKGTDGYKCLLSMVSMYYPKDDTSSIYSGYCGTKSFLWAMWREMNEEEAYKSEVETLEKVFCMCNYQDPETGERYRRKVMREGKELIPLNKGKAVSISGLIPLSDLGWYDIFNPMEKEEQKKRITELEALTATTTARPEGQPTDEDPKGGKGRYGLLKLSCTQCIEAFVLLLSEATGLELMEDGEIPSIRTPRGKAIVELYSVVSGKSVDTCKSYIRQRNTPEKDTLRGEKMKEVQGMITKLLRELKRE